MFTHTNISKETWESIRKYMMETELHPSIVDSVILKLFKNKNLVDVGILYYKFLVNNNCHLNVITQTTFLELYEHKISIDETDKEYVLNLYKYFISEYSSLEINMSTALVVSLCKIGESKKAMEIIERFERNDQIFLRVAYDVLISHLYDCGEADKAYEYLLISFKKGPGPLNGSYISYWKYHSKDRCTFTQKVERLFSLWRKYGIKPSEESIRKCMMICNDLGWSAKLTKLDGLKCTVCKQELSQILSKKDYERLCKVVKEKLIFDNLYIVSNPKEVQNFIKYIEKGTPYDIIVDGLNFICRSFGSYKQLQRLIVKQAGEGKKVLVIGRKHIKKHIIENSLANYFYVDNMSKDDLFVLYAALSSGPNAKVISNDLMRQHEFIINDVELQTLFKKWQIAQQYSVQSSYNLQQLTKISTPIDAIVQKQSNCWHIPYNIDDCQPRQRHISNDDWACFNTCP
ncbi:Mitochondrial ribonuclease P protein 3 [Habropoda laboriosa]|uniref:Mitochondrial ribonuclease P protein 3 n=2 Tax=Habropoda laboriosa TaxID=597456 RepID=A0A0L7QNP6_9HYME|nr:Mitochondrial ribonuclease P protein 3 [Habropoda laboriosa]